MSGDCGEGTKDFDGATWIIDFDFTFQVPLEHFEVCQSYHESNPKENREIKKNILKITEDDGPNIKSVQAQERTNELSLEEGKGGINESGEKLLTTQEPFSGQGLLSPQSSIEEGNSEENVDVGNNEPIEDIGSNALNLDVGGSQFRGDVGVHKQNQGVDDITGIEQDDFKDNIAKCQCDIIHDLHIQEARASLKTEVIDECSKNQPKSLEKLIVGNVVNAVQHFNLSPQEPWPKDVKLFQPYEIEQILLPDNANCLAVQAFLKMCNLDFQVEPRANAEAMSPSGKVPFIKAGAFVVSELEPIVQFVNNKGITLTEKLDTNMKSDMRAYMSLVHNVLEVAELYICWLDKETYNEVTSSRYGSIYPWPLNHIQNRAKKGAVTKKLRVLEWYQKTMPEVFQEIENCCQALTDRLDMKEYFFGDKPTELDALVFGHIFTILTTPLPNTHIASIVRNYPVLISLVQKIEREYFKRELKQ